jgi:hypothetical protein
VSFQCERAVIRRSTEPPRCHPERSEGAKAPPGTRRLVVGLLLLAACASPEAARTRGDGPGADVGNHRTPVEIHAGANPYHDTPCVTEPVECKGPPPVFGPAPPPD